MAIAYQYANAEKTKVYTHAGYPSTMLWDAVKDRPRDAYGADMALWISQGRPKPAPYVATK